MNKPLFNSSDADYIFIKHALATKLSDYFDDCSSAYLFTNENHIKLFQSLDCRNKDILTACAGSGDVLFNAKLSGAGRVDQFDISLFPKYTFEIKYQALSSLTHAEFLRFFYHSRYFLNKKNGEKFAQLLSKPAAYLLDQTQQSEYCADWAYRISRTGETIRQTYPRQSPYLASKKSYDTVRQRLPKESSFYTGPLTDIPYSLERPYDIIYLSNICQYIKDTRSFEDTVVRPLSQFLKKDGKIVCYQLGGSLNSWTLKDLERQFAPANRWKISIKAIDDIYTKSRLSNEADTFFVMQKTR